MASAAFPARPKGLSDHFTLAELTRSQTAIARNLDNTPSEQVVTSLRSLCLFLLEPVRAEFGLVRVTSGYRAPAVNRAAGGAPSSQHVLGEAADFTVPGVSNLVVCRWIAAHIPFDQVIYEFGERGWIHASYRLGRLRHSKLRAVRGRGGRTVYLEGF